MTDRELLELAAKASGELTESWYGNHAYFDGMLSRWNPLTDDGDALRLVVMLRLGIVWRPDGRVEVSSERKAMGIYSIESSRENTQVNLRRAIVRAAAEMGKDIMNQETKPRIPAGPKTRIPNRRTINISLAAEQIEKARKIGRGNTSAGIRAAIDEYEAKE